MSESSPEYQRPRFTDDELTEMSIDRARAEGREIDDATARMIAAQLHAGQDTALYSFASTGAIDRVELASELLQSYKTINFQEVPHVEAWVGWLGTYAIMREDEGPIDGWHTLWLGDQS